MLLYILVHLRHHDADCGDIAARLEGCACFEVNIHGDDDPHDDDSGIGEPFATGNDGYGDSTDSGDRISEDNSLGPKSLNGLEDNVRRSKLACVHGPVHLDEEVPAGLIFDHLGCLRLLKDGNVLRGEKEKVEAASLLG